MRITQTRLDRMARQLNAEYQRVEKLRVSTGNDISAMCWSAKGSDSRITEQLWKARKSLFAALLSLEDASNAVEKASETKRVKG